MDLTLKEIIVDWLSARDYKLNLCAVVLDKYSIYSISQPEIIPHISNGPMTAMMILEDKIQLGESLSLSNQMGSKPMSLDHLIAELPVADPEFFNKVNEILHRQPIQHTTYSTSYDKCPNVFMIV